MLQTLPCFCLSFWRQMCCSDALLAGERRQSVLYDAGGRWNGRRWRNNRLHGCKMEVSIEPGAAQRVTAHALSVCLFVFCQTLILPEGKTAHYANRDSYRDTLYRQQTRTNGCSWRRRRKKTVLWADNEAWTSPTLTGDLIVQLRSSETEFKAV